MTKNWSIKTEINRLQFAMLLAPLGTGMATIGLSFMVWMLLASLESESGEAPQPIELINGYRAWLATYPQIVGEDLDISAALLALGALTLAMFLTLNMSSTGDDSIKPRAVQAQLVVLSKLSLSTATLNAMGAWITVPLIGINEDNIPEIVLATAIALLCSTLVPLHLERSTTLQLGLQESRLLRTRILKRNNKLRSKTDSGRTSRLHQHPRLSLCVWVLAVGALNGAIGATFFLTAIPYGPDDSQGAVIFASSVLGFVTLLLACLWARCTAWFYTEWLLDRARGKMSWIITTPIAYVLVTLILALLFWAILGALAGPRAATISVALSTASFHLAYYLDRRHVHLLDGYVDIRFANALNHINVNIESLTRGLRNARDNHGFDEGQRLMRSSKRRARTPRRMR